ncbi:MAG: hypothetical protein U5S82_17415 [Gammaproteobacteria bacterium]|nr:hypothetical protein [Gammaproteobacteria bacterium]
MESRDQLQEERIARFWKRYVGALRLRQVPENAVPWYRKHVQAFIDFAPDIRLVNRRPETLEQWFAHTSREPRLTGWKHRQRVDALRLLYCLLVKSEWASGFDWAGWAEWKPASGRFQNAIDHNYWRPGGEKTSTRCSMHTPQTPRVTATQH